jgi:uncharacterized protein (DUF1499 family)
VSDGDRQPRRRRWVVVLGLLLVVIVTARLAVGLVPPPEIGLRVGELYPCPDSDNCVRSGASDERHAIEPLPCSEDRLEEVVGVGLAVLPRTEMVVVRDGYAHLRSTSRWMGFVDDLELLADGEIIEVRAAARLGRQDFGVNRDRVESLREAVADAGICT